MAVLAGGVLLACGALLAAAPAASAHIGAAGGSGPTNWSSEIVSVSPAMPGVTLRLPSGGDRLELVNSSPRTILVYGYDGEPYLRITPSTVDTNLHSAATYINATADGRSPVPSTVDPRVAPSWRRVADRGRYVWHDHRTHWMGAGLPAAVQAAPGVARLVAEWTLPLRYGTLPVVVVSGRLSWVPAPWPWPWLGVVVGLASLSWVLAGLPQWRVALPPLVVCLVLANLVHLAFGGLRSALAAADQVVPAVLAWVLGSLSAVAAVRGRSWAPYAMALSTATIGVVSGLTDLAELTHSQLPSAGPPWLARGCVSTILGLSLGLTLAGWRIWRREQPLPRQPSSATLRAASSTSPADDSLAPTAAPGPPSSPADPLR